MRRLALSPRARRVLRATLFTGTGARRWMSAGRRKAAVYSFGLMLAVVGAMIGIMLNHGIGAVLIGLVLIVFFASYIVHEVAIGLELLEKQDYADEMTAAQRVQELLLPSQLPCQAGLCLAGASTPARDVGGDYYDVLDLGEKRYALVVADVAGKGVPAALLMATVRTLVRDRARRGLAPEELIREVNQALLQDTSATQYATIFYGILDLDRRELAYVNAGHATPYLVTRREPALQALDRGGPPVGLLDAVTYAVARVTVAPGDRIVVYTDGLIDIDPGNDRFLDDQELEALLLRLRAVTPAEMVSALCAQVRRLRGGGEGEDDLTLLVAALE